MMNKRQRKKYLKSKGKYISMSELWDLDYTFADFILPRLKAFKKNTISVPAQLSETEWNDILDKMILAFDYIIAEDSWWIDDPRYDYIDYCHFSHSLTKEGLRQVSITEEERGKKIKEAYFKEEKRRCAVIEEGLALFAKYFRDLWI